jgi:hypothetical protein
MGAGRTPGRKVHAGLGMVNETDHNCSSTPRKSLGVARPDDTCRACAQAAGGPGGVKAVQVKARDSDWMGMTNKCAHCARLHGRRPCAQACHLKGVAVLDSDPVCTCCRRISSSACVNGDW